MSGPTERRSLRFWIYGYSDISFADKRSPFNIRIGTDSGSENTGVLNLAQNAPEKIKLADA